MELSEVEKKLEDIKKSNINFDDLRMDVGSASIAPHAANWLLAHPGSSVLLIEPNPINVENLINGNDKTPEYIHVFNMGIPSLRLIDRAILTRGEKRNEYKEEQVFLLDFAIDNVDEPKKTTFYCSDERNRGCSSLLAPSSEFVLTMESTKEVNTVSLEYILDYINFPPDKLIKFVKTDTQGKDFDVIKSLGKYLNQVIALKCEYNVGNNYINSCSEKDFLEFMINHNFRLVNQDSHDFYFINKKYDTKENLIEFSNLPII